MEVKKDCYAYKNNGCWALNDLYCKKEVCKFYNNKLSIPKLKQEMVEYQRIHQSKEK